jgi:hypothetical protein
VSHIDFKPGDMASIIAHTWAPVLYPHDQRTEPASSGWVVVGVDRRLRCRGYMLGHDEFTLEKLPEADTGWEQNQFRFIKREDLTLDKAGNGRFTRGVDIPFNLTQQRLIRFEAFRIKVATAIVSRGSHEGWSNPATWHVNLCLTNNQRFTQGILPTLWRKNGSINPNKLARWWHDMLGRKLIEPIEDWMVASPIDIPEEFASWNLPELQALRIDWNEIAADLARKPAISQP